MSTRRLISLGTLLAGCIICSCGHDPLVGDWRREGDIYAGAVVRVEKIQNAYYGKLLQVPDSMRFIGFVVGDMKWRDVVPVTSGNGSRRYMGKDLLKYGLQGEVASTRYDDMTIELRSGSMVHLRLLAKGEEYVGTEQVWRKNK